MNAHGRYSGNSGIENTGSGTINISGSAVGPNSRVLNTSRDEPRARPADRSPGDRWDVGVITIVSPEARAVIDALGRAGTCRERIRAGGLRFHEANVPAGGQRASVVATQALEQGQRAAVIAYSQLFEHYRPACVVLVGIAGSISPRAQIGDVVVVRDVTYYEARRETPSGAARRGQEHHVPAHIRRAVNAFFAARGEPYHASHTGPDGDVCSFDVMPGPIGSGEAVITDQNSPIRSYLTEYNEKIVAVETEAAGVAEAFYAQAGHIPTGHGWLAIRGISDRADPDKGYSDHPTASEHAAIVLLELLPYLIESTTAAD
jgi:adenosylhomocysteine nucleosidase